ncbi:hypothetical protein DPMN_181514 [Dreissena polymorpha]|uniref:Uncharacterized protein n=1 Tax=Dreissena polymorpha TaxID=45954 RepID=A0A9D4DCH7_DREPO|nr:hypothetical protein DPMN_181514 [Dreissena polymorpha]
MTVGAQAEESQTVCDGAKTVWAPAGDLQTVFDGVRDFRALLQTVWESPEVAQTVLVRRRMYGSLLHVPAGLGDCLSTSHTFLGSA